MEKIEDNTELLLKAFEETPSLILDCGNIADVHKLFGKVREEQLHCVYVMNAEAVYRYRDALRQIPYWIKKLGIKRLIITPIHTLFSYDDEIENKNVLEHCAELISEIDKETPVYVGVDQEIEMSK